MDSFRCTQIRWISRWLCPVLDANTRKRWAMRVTLVRWWKWLSKKISILCKLECRSCSPKLVPAKPRNHNSTLTFSLKTTETTATPRNLHRFSLRIHRIVVFPSQYVGWSWYGLSYCHSINENTHIIIIIYRFWSYF